MPDDPAAILDSLDFGVVCALTHMGRPCERLAAYFATIHDCSSKTGTTRAPICRYFLVAAASLPYPVHCPHCPHVMEDRGDYITDIQPVNQYRK